MLFQHKIIKPMYRHRYKNEAGVVIVVALFIVALVATIAYVMMARLARDTYRTRLLISDVKAEGYAQGAIAWAIDKLRQDWENKKSNVIVDAIPIQSPLNHINGYQVSAVIYDMQGRFNLNNLLDVNERPLFLQLLRIIAPTLSDGEAQAMMQAIVDWISPGGGQSTYKQNDGTAVKPYQPAHRFMQTTTELGLIKGVTPALYKALEPYVSALPEKTPINVQTAAIPVLAALSPTMNLTSANLLAQIRQQKPFDTLQAFLNTDIVKNHAVKSDDLTVVSNYFLVETKVTIEQQHVLIDTLLQRSTQGRKAKLTILWQSKGVSS